MSALLHVHATVHGPDITYPSQHLKQGSQRSPLHYYGEQNALAVLCELVAHANESHYVAVVAQSPVAVDLMSEARQRCVVCLWAKLHLYDLDRYGVAMTAMHGHETRNGHAW